MIAKLFAIAATTFLETIRQPIYGVILLLTPMFLVFNVSLAGFTLDDDNKLLQDLGLSTLLLSGLFLAAFSATGVLAREIENKTVLTVISKPVGRPTFILGKFLGLAGAMTVAFYLCSIVFLMTMRHRILQTSSDKYDMPVLFFGFGGLLLTLLVAGVCNFLYRTTFSSTAVGLAVGIFTVAILLVLLIGPEWEIQTFGQDFADGQVPAAVALVFLAVLVLTAVAMAASTRFREIVTLVVCVGVLQLGLFSDYLFGKYSDQSALTDAVYRFMPNLAFFWITDALTQGHEVTTEYVLLVASYATCYIVAALLLAIALFQRREVG